MNLSFAIYLFVVGFIFVVIFRGRMSRKNRILAFVDILLLLACCFVGAGMAAQSGYGRAFFYGDCRELREAIQDGREAEASGALKSYLENGTLIADTLRRDRR